MGLEVTQGIIRIKRIEKLQYTGCVVYQIHTEQKRPEVVSWGRYSLTLLPAGSDWNTVTPSDYTVIRFPPLTHWTAVYQEERYSIFFIQFNENVESETVWEDNA